ncbi:uncharacterized protein LOC136714203 [Amia ocellicauda]|uniref:uncharacterized protein LOC136714203 n=1 Tax=Amia ocellicauda TaxID=2972642 RepID=UPI003464AE3B
MRAVDGPPGRRTRLSLGPHEDSELEAELMEEELVSPTPPPLLNMESLQLPWPSDPAQLCSRFERGQHSQQPTRLLPYLLEELRAVWDHAPALARRGEAYARTQGMAEAGLVEFPQVNSTIPTLVSLPLLSAQPCNLTCPNRECHVTETLLRRAYKTGAQAARLRNTESLLALYLSQLAEPSEHHSASPTPPPISEIAAAADQLVTVIRQGIRVTGRSLATIVAACRQLWLSQALWVPEVDRTRLMDAPISPGFTFGPSVEAMLTCALQEREQYLQLARIYPILPQANQRRQSVAARRRGGPQPWVPGHSPGHRPDHSPGHSPAHLSISASVSLAGRRPPRLVALAPGSPQQLVVGGDPAPSLRCSSSLWPTLTPPSNSQIGNSAPKTLGCSKLYQLATPYNFRHVHLPSRAWCGRE